MCTVQCSSLTGPTRIRVPCARPPSSVAMTATVRRAGRMSSAGVRSITVGYGCPHKADFDFSPHRCDHRRMELRHLRTIDAVARHRSFTKAAEELYLAQSAISQQISRLEAEIGIQIFRRSSRSVELTEEGKVILDHAKRVLAEVEEMQGEMEALTGVMRGTVRIGGIYPFGPYDLYGVLAEYRERYPGVAIHMVEDTQDEMLAMLRGDELDCAFASVDPDTIGSEFAGTLLWEEEFVVISSPDHAFAAQPTVTWDEVIEQDLIAYRENSALRRRFETTIGR